MRETRDDHTHGTRQKAQMDGSLPSLSARHGENPQTKVETSRCVRLPSLTQLHAQDGSPCVCDPPSRAQSWAVAPQWAVTEQHQVVLGSESLSPLFGMASKAIVPHRVTSAPCTCHGREGHGWGLAILASTLGVWLGSSLKAKPFPLWAFCSASHRSLSLLCWNTNK